MAGAVVRASEDASGQQLGRAVLLLTRSSHGRHIDDGAEVSSAGETVSMQDTCPVIESFVGGGRHLADCVWAFDAPMELHARSAVKVVLASVESVERCSSAEHSDGEVR